MYEPEQPVNPCPRCGTAMLIGRLQDPVNVIYIESLCSLKSSSLHAWVCPACGHVDLQAVDPQNLACHDISDENLGIGQEDWSEDF
jgi:predicted RNA-binding Zn-ribbon protein involved in translation (DUF1610 family)